MEAQLQPTRFWAALHTAERVHGRANVTQTTGTGGVAGVAGEAQT